MTEPLRELESQVLNDFSGITSNLFAEPGRALALYSLYRAKAYEAVSDHNPESWDARGSIYRVGSLVQTRLTQLTIGQSDNPLFLRELVSDAEAQLPSLAKLHGSETRPLRDRLHITIIGATGTAVAASILHGFIPEGWKCADVELDVSYGVDVVFEDGRSRLQSKAVQPNNYRHNSSLQRQIFKDGDKIDIPILRMRQGQFELQFAPLGLVAYDSGYIVPTVLNRVEGQKTLVFSRPRAADTDDLYEALFDSISAVVDNETARQAWQKIYDIWEQKLIEEMMLDFVKGNSDIKMKRFMTLAPGLVYVDNMEILTKIKQLPHLTPFAKDITRMILLSRKADDEGKGPRPEFDSYPSTTNYYTETAIFDKVSGKKPEVSDYVQAAAFFIQGIKGLNYLKLVKADSETLLDYYKKFPTEPLPVIEF